MTAQSIIPAIACFFFLLAIYHLAGVRSNMRQSHNASPIAVRVQKKVGAVFLLVGAGLLVYYGLLI